MRMPKWNVLIVDDEPSIADAVATAMRDGGFATTVVGDGLSALLEIRSGVYSLVVLDVMLPGLSGFEIARVVRDEGISTPIIFLTARHGLNDKVEGLRRGDDYLTKPFAVVELVARAHAILRRSLPFDSARNLRCGDVEIDVDAHGASRSGSALRLTATEFRLLHYLVVNADRVVSKQQILDDVWGYSFDGDEGVVETYIRYLRRKLDEHGPALIETVRLVGYVLRSRPVDKADRTRTP